MQLFKNTVALEACPAKTAESVSYGATFTVLGWLLISNYTGFGSAERDSQLIANTGSVNEETPTLTTFNLNLSATFAATVAPKETLYAAAALQQLDSEALSSNFLTSAPAWHAELEPYESQTHLRTFSTAGWSHGEIAEDPQIEGFIGGLALPLPLIAIDFPFDTMSTSETSYKESLASSDAGTAELIREITVTGTSAKRLSNRPDNVQRPQIPRPYRAQEIPRSLLLPPRIQALRP